jgi:hypothetical protein
VDDAYDDQVCAPGRCRQRRHSQRPQKVFQRLAEDLNPEACYVLPGGGERGGFFVVDMRESSQIAEIAERFFFGLNAKIEMTPVMAVDDLQKALSGVQRTIQRYG